MSLLVHLPLNGNLENKGLLGNLTPTDTPAYVNNGKIGKALSNGGCKMTTELTALVLNNNEMSFAFWIYINAEEGSTNGLGIIFGNNGMTGPNNRKFAIFTYPNCNSLHLSWMNDGNNTFIAPVYSNIIPSYKWTHVTVTYKNPTITVYINGQYYTKTTGVSNSASFAYETPIVRASQYRYFNDFRIYNHCLSPKEVKEISKGLILHYPLDDIIQPNLIPNQGQYTESNPYVLTTTANDGNRWLQNSAFEVKPSTTYTYSVCCDGEIASAHAGALGTFSMWLYLCNNGTSKNWQNGEYDTPRVFLSNNNNHKLIGNRHIWTYTTTANEKYMSIRMNNYGTGGVTHNYWNFKVEEGNVCTLWLPNVNDSLYNESNFGTNTIYDCSGFRNNGTVTGTLSLSNDSPRNNCSLVFDSSSAISCTSMYPTGTDINSLSVSVWFKTNTMNGTTPNFWSLGLNSFIRMRIASASSVWWYGLINSTNVGISYNTGKTITDNTWHHVVYTFNNGISKVYLDGTYIGGTDSSSTGTALKMNSTNWRLSAYSGTSEKFIGQLSDFRIYCTALSADDILELYNTSAFITNNGTTECYEFDETGSNPIINKTGVVSVGNMYEEPAKYCEEVTWTGNGISNAHPNNTINYCSVGYNVNLSNIVKGKPYVIEMDFIWLGTWTFDSSLGTTRFIIQGTLDGQWSGNNYVNAALNNQRSLYNLVNNTTSGGSYHFKTQFIIPSDYTYSVSQIGTRSDYMSGNGTYSILNLKIYPAEMRLDTEQTKFGSDFITSKQFNEI